MQLLELTNMVTSEANKASVTSAIARTKIKAALIHLDGKQDWQYLDRFVTFDILAEGITDLDTRAIPIPTDLKSVEFIRILGSDGEYCKLTEVEPSDIAGTITDMPTRYWKDGMQYFWLDNTPDQDYSAEMSYRQMTTFTDSDTYEHWLMRTAPMLVFYQTMLFLGPWMRELELAAAYKGLRDESLQDALRLDEELRFSNQDLRMNPA